MRKKRVPQIRNNLQDSFLDTSNRKRYPLPVEERLRASAQRAATSPANTLLECLRGDIFPTSGTGNLSQLVDRDGLVGGITIGIEALVTGNAIIVSLHDCCNNCLAEGLGSIGITGTGRRFGTTLNRRLDRVQQDLGTVIAASAIRAICVLTIRIIELLQEGRSRWQLGRINSRNGAIHWQAVCAKRFSERAGLQAIAAYQRGGRQTRSLGHLLGNVNTAGGVQTSEVDDGGLQVSNLRQLLAVVGGRRDAIVAQDCAAIGL